MTTQVVPRRPSRLARFILIPLLVILFPLFVCGGLVAGYYFFDTVREYAAKANLPSYGGVVYSGSAPQQAIVAPVAPVMPNIAAGERVNVLLLGIDKREGETGPFRTDTMIVATLDPKTKTAGMLSIPRDLYVPIPLTGVGENRINTANFFGESYKYPGGGPALAKKTVEYNFGIPIHFYVLIDFGGFRKIVDTLGGIDVDVAQPIDDNEYPTENYGTRSIHIPAGHLHMNGELALMYARTRHSTNDFDRSRRQIQIILAIRDKALKIDALTKLPQLYAQFKDTVQSDLSVSDILTLVPASAQIRKDNIKTRAIDQTMTDEVMYNGADVLWPRRDKIAAAVAEIFAPNQLVVSAESALKQENARIAVLNGTPKAGYAERAANYLKARGLNVSSSSNADRLDYKQTLIVYAGDKPITLDALTKSFPNAKLQKAVPDNSGADFRIIVGSDWTAPAQ